MPNIVEKFSDGKTMVRSANLKAMKLLVDATSPEVVLDQLAAHGLSHVNAAVREESVNACIAIMLQVGGAGVCFDLQGVQVSWREGQPGGRGNICRCSWIRLNPINQRR